jgi:hypothetical protein
MILLLLSSLAAFAEPCPPEVTPNLAPEENIEEIAARLEAELAEEEAETRVRESLLAAVRAALPTRPSSEPPSVRLERSGDEYVIQVRDSSSGPILFEAVGTTAEGFFQGRLRVSDVVRASGFLDLNGTRLVISHNAEFVFPFGRPLDPSRGLRFLGFIRVGAQAEVEGVNLSRVAVEPGTLGMALEFGGSAVREPMRIEVSAGGEMNLNLDHDSAGPMPNVSTIFSVPLQ